MSDLTSDEQKNVRTALRFLRTRCGGWDAVAKALRFKKCTIAHTLNGRTVSASLAIRLARFAGVSVDDVLCGRYPAPGTCPYCGHCPTRGAAEVAAQPDR